MTRQLELSHNTEAVLGELAGLRGALAAGLLASSGSGFVAGGLLILSATDNPQRTKHSTADLCESVAIENPNAVPLLVELDGPATALTARYRVPPFRGRMIPQPHRVVSIGVDPAILGEESSGQVLVTVSQYVRAYAPTTWSLVNTPAAYMTPNALALVASTPQTGPNVPAASIYLQAAIGNAAPVFFGAPSMNIASGAGVMGELAAGGSVVLELANLNMLAFESTSNGTLYATALA